jgi:hypothetical protein
MMSAFDEKVAIIQVDDEKKFIELVDFLKDEYIKFQNRIVILEDVLGSDLFGVSDEEESILTMQVLAMRLYIQCIKQRLTMHKVDLNFIEGVN